ncbi:Tetratricopeptide repeat-domain-containing protein [Hypoxylon rubiginosum]|uniref:Tetratricopeptide repeat-domain-containing protein n=1 Tax=Hypoxylon rubiginosum TaxID=110542 RepID=A0ACB9ZDX8_9PEZI|nr:Tetratricopeptide repeat-domain-containing protein [Hypoxylon rubiginosum]
MDNLANTLYKQGKYNEAERIYCQVLELRRRVPGEEHLSTIATMDNLSAVFKDQGKDEEAELMYRQALALRERG